MLRPGLSAQSAFVVHSTHSRLAGSQTSPGSQSASTAHSTQNCPVGSQTPSGPHWPLKQGNLQTFPLLVSQTRWPQ